MDYDNLFENIDNVHKNRKLEHNSVERLLVQRVIEEFTA